MSRVRTAIVLVVAAAAVVAAVIRFSNARADDEDEEQRIISRTAQVSRDAAGDVVVAVKPAAQKEIGLRVETLPPVVWAVEAEAYGFVLDPAPLSRLNSSLMSTQAALDASRAQYRRSRRLFGERKNVSLRELQSARAAYLNDEARAEALEQQLLDSWGNEIAHAEPRARADLVSALIGRRAALARVTLPSGVMLNDSTRQADVLVLGHEQQPLRARAVYDAPMVNRRRQGQTFFLLIGTRQFPVRPGTAVSARLPEVGKPVQGVMIPRSAVVRYAGSQWIYQEAGSGRFVRREIVPAESTAEGYFVTQGVAPEMRVIVSGAQALLSEELKSQIRPAD